MESKTEDVVVDLDEDDIEAAAPTEATVKSKVELRARCAAAGLEFKEDASEEGSAIAKVGMKCAREVRWLMLGTDESISRLLSIQFEKFIFISGYDAICSYERSTIEASVRGFGNFPTTFIYRRLFGLQSVSSIATLEASKLEILPPQSGLPRIEISIASDEFSKLVRTPSRRLTLKLSGCDVKTHDQARLLLRKVADAVFFQIDLLTDISLGLERARNRSVSGRRTKRDFNLAVDLQYPRTEFDEAPTSLYWYGRSASGMPLLQFLAFYQVLEFYYPTYSEAEARRKLKSILKDPVFRGDRDADIGRILTAIHVNRSGAFGDERSQLKATIMECIDAERLHAFLSSDPERLDFYSAKTKSGVFHKLPVTTPNVDLRADVAERIYNIRCKIVHTKVYGRDADNDLLLPFSKEAEQLNFDIELVQYLAQQVLIAASTQRSFQS